MPTSPRHRFAITLLFITPAFWSVNYLVARSAPGVIEPHLLALLRWLIAGLILAAVGWRELVVHRAHIRAEWLRYLVLGALGMWICGAWVYIGGRTTSAVNIALIYTLSPVFIVLFSALWLKEAFNSRQAVGVALALAGVLHVILAGQWTALASVQFVPGDAWIFAASIAWSAYALLLRRWTSPISAGARLAVISLSGVLVLLPFTIWEVWGISELAHNSAPALTQKGMLLVLAAAIFPGCLAYWAYAVIQRELGAARASMVQYLGPLYAAGMGWAVLGESLKMHHALGLVLVLSGIYLVTQSVTAPKPPAASAPAA
jgi:drug/metabolite transporter (DMT)-like permease